MFGLGLGKLGGAVRAAEFVPAFSPLSLFLNGEQGAWYDPSDLSTMFQDSAGTTPVTADGQPVGKILDKSGRGNHATQATAASRPLYKTDGTYSWLQFDGVDDSLSTAAINFTSTDKMSMFVGMRKQGTTSWQQLTELSSNSDTNVGSFGINAPPGAIDGITSYVHGATAITNSAVTGLTPPIKLVFTSQQNLAGTSVALCVSSRINGAASGTSSGALAGGGNYGTYPLYIGARGGVSTRLDGNIYSLIVRGAASTAQEITDTETWVNSKTGAY